MDKEFWETPQSSNTGGPACARDRLLAEIVKPPEDRPRNKQDEATQQPQAAKDALGAQKEVGNELLHAGSSAIGIGLGALMGRMVATPTRGEIAALTAKYPLSSWPRMTGNSVRMELENVVSWGPSIGKAYPEAETVLTNAKRSGLVNSFTAAVAGTAINYALDKTVYGSAQYGTYSAIFDSVGVAVIAGMPEIPAFAKTAVIVGGHALARKLDRSSWSVD